MAPNIIMPLHRCVVDRCRLVHDHDLFLHLFGYCSGLLADHLCFVGRPFQERMQQSADIKADASHGVAVMLNPLMKIGQVAIACFAALQSLSISGAPASAAQNCGPGWHWVQTGSAYGAGYCKPKHRRDHQVCAIGYHYEGDGVCRRNGSWWSGRRPIDWGPRYEPGRPEGGVTFRGPNGGDIRVRW